MTYMHTGEAGGITLPPGKFIFIKLPEDIIHVEGDVEGWLTAGILMQEGEPISISLVDMETEVFLVRYRRQFNGS
jgi:hypothetical protein